MAASGPPFTSGARRMNALLLRFPEPLLGRHPHRHGSSVAAELAPAVCIDLDEVRDVFGEVSEASVLRGRLHPQRRVTSVR